MALKKIQNIQSIKTTIHNTIYSLKNFFTKSLLYKYENIFIQVNTYMGKHS
jgi:hypothetical protein